MTGRSLFHQRFSGLAVPKLSNRHPNLIQIELQAEAPIKGASQSRNEKDCALRMAEYLFGIGHGRLPRQVALYVGEAPLRMKDRVEGPGVSVQFHLVDIRDLNGERLLASAHVGE